MGWKSCDRHHIRGKLCGEGVCVEEMILFRTPQLQHGDRSIILAEAIRHRQTDLGEIKLTRQMQEMVNI